MNALNEMEFSYGKFSSRKIWDCPVVIINPQVRIYYRKLKEGGVGFVFHAVEWAEGGSDDNFFNFTTKVNTLCEGIAFYDGVRHLDFGEFDDDRGTRSGYLNYPNLATLAEVFLAIVKLENTFCKEQEQ